MDSHHLLPVFEAGMTNVHRYKPLAIDRVFSMFWLCLFKDLKESESHKFSKFINKTSHTLKEDQYAKIVFCLFVAGFSLDQMPVPK